MRVVPARVVLLAAMALVSATAALEAQVEERTIYVSATDKSDAPVAGLQAGEFVVREDGMAREVLRASVATEPMQIALLVDTSQVTEPYIPDVRRALTGFFKEMGGRHEIALIGFGERPTVLVDYTKDTTRLEKGLGSVFAKPGSGTYLLEAIVESANALGRRKASRPQLVVIVAEGAEFSERHHDNVLEQLRDSGAAMHSFTLTRTGGGRRDSAGLELEMSIAEGTQLSGGRREDLLTVMALPDRLRSLAIELNGQYQVTYARPRTLIPPKGLDVSAKRTDITVRARRWP